MKFLNRIFNSGPSNPVDALVAEYLTRLRNGEDVDYNQFIAANPELAIELNNALRNELDLLDINPTQKANMLGTLHQSAFDSTSDTFTSSHVRNRNSMSKGFRIGDFVVESELGRGGMARVYKAWQESCNRHVALKTILTDSFMQEMPLSRLKREAMVQAQLCHPNIVRLYTCALTDNVPYLVMELIEGGTTLQSLLAASQKPFDETRAAKIILAVARALDYSHQKGVVHRDIKASNIMMDGDTPKLTDFGLAFMQNQQLTRLTRSGELLGTFGYIAPEIVGISREKKYETPKPQTDIYSLGVTLYELLTGKLPFQADSPGELIFKILEKDPVPPHKLGIKLGKKIEAICVKCMEKSVEKRYQSAAELAEDLERFLGGEAVQAPSVHWKTRKLKHEFSKRKLALTTSFLTVLSITVLSFLTAKYNYRQDVSLLLEHRGTPPEVGEDYTISFLLKAAKDNSVDVRVSAIVALCRHQGELVDEALLEAVNDPDEKVRFHLATALLESSNPVKEEICEILLRGSNGFVAAAAIRLAEQLDDPRFMPFIEQLSLSDEKVLRNYALKTILSSVDDNKEFVRFYFKNGPQEGRNELLEYMLKGRTRPAIPELIDLLEFSDLEEEKNLIHRILSAYTNVDLGVEYEEWRRWWATNAKHWSSRRCLIVTWAPKHSKLVAGDVIWSIDGNEILHNIGQKRNQTITLNVIRDKSLVAMKGPFSNIKHRLYYIGMMNSSLIGTNSFVEKISIALASRKSR